MSPRLRHLPKAGAWALAILPAAHVTVDLATGGLGANPIAEALNRTGLASLLLLVATLACTPLRHVTGWSWPAPLRRHFGLAAFFYATVHLALYAGLDQFFDAAAIGEDLVKRRFITVGAAAWLLLLPLGITSTEGWMRRLGGARWRALHRLAYAAAVLASVHYVWRDKLVHRGALAFVAAIAVLLGLRVVRALAKRARAARADAPLATSSERP